MKPKTKATLMTGVIMILVGVFVYFAVRFTRIILVGVICAFVCALGWLIYDNLLEHYRKKENK